VLTQSLCSRKVVERRFPNTQRLRQYSNNRELQWQQALQPIRELQQVIQILDITTSKTHNLVVATKDYSQWIDRSISPVAGGYNDVQDPQPGGGYKDYSQWIEDERIADNWYNDGPWNEESITLRDSILTNSELVRKLQDRNLLSEAMSNIVKGG
jgi:hypothetical protein